jgi:hypothetical protein
LGTTPPGYRTIDQPVGAEVIAIDGYGGQYGDPIAAWIKVEGWVRLQVVAAPDRDTWTSADEERFRQAVRNIAETHPDLPMTGVTLLFDPPRLSVDDGSTPLGEPVARRNRG